MRRESIVFPVSTSSPDLANCNKSLSENTRDENLTRRVTLMFVELEFA